MKLPLPALVACFVLAQAPPFATATAKVHRADAARATTLAPEARYATVTKNFERRFEVDEVGDIRLENRHGAIDYRIATDGAVRIRVVASATAASEQKAQSILDDIDVAISGTRTRVTARTSLSSGGNTHIINDGEVTKRGFEVNYTVYAPAGFRLSLKNDFGDVKLPDLTSQAKLEVGYGNLVAGDLAAGSRVKIDFGDATIGYVPDLDAEVRYGELDVGGAGTARITARFSELELGRFGELAMDSQYGGYAVQSASDFRSEGGYNDLRIDSAERVHIEGDYNDVKVGYLATGARFSIGFGDVHVSSTSGALEVVDFEGAYTDITLVLAEGLDYTLDAETSFGDLRYPKGLMGLEETSGATNESVAGRSGNTGKTRVTLRGSFGDLVVR